MRMVSLKYYLLTILALMVFGVPAISSRFSSQVGEIANVFSNATNQLATVILSHNPKSVADIQADYLSANSTIFSTTSTVTTDSANSTTTNKVRILLVPGHEPNYGGAEYANIKERNMTVELAQNLSDFLGNDSHYQVFVTRDSSDWSPVFVDYFKNDWQSIVDWENVSIRDMAQRISIGSSTKPIQTVSHNRVPNDVATRLYGITKWANENNIDITIHIHFNDDTEHPANQAGKHTGFAIYIPQHQYANGTTSRDIAETVFKRLSKYNPVSDLAGESTGIIEDSDLIAIGANNTADSASMLIEYGYIYESQFNNLDTSSIALKDLAYQTYLGLQDFFDPTDSVATGSVATVRAYDTVALPHSWIRVVSDKNTQNADVFSLQSALLADGEYPPASKNISQCPRTGSFGACTRSALQVFQKKNNITGEKGIVGEKTLEALNRNYGF